MKPMNPMQNIKRSFFAMRNGLLADRLRRGPAATFRIIFGLNLPQLSDIAKATGHDADLARKLWANTSTRESMLIAPMLLEPDDLSDAEALRMATEAPTPEVADVLCHRLLRHHTASRRIIDTLIADPEPMFRYTALRLTINTMGNKTYDIRDTAALATRLAEEELQRDTPLTRPIATQLAQEAKWLLNPDT